jgi:hypothetical protein
MTTTTTDTTTLVADYLAMWRETDEAARAERIAQVFTEDGRHVDPNADAQGHAGLAEMITAVHALYPGFTMRQTTAIDAHNDQLRFGWQLQSADGSLTLDGIDVGEVAADGRLQRITGFWGDLPAA